MCANTAALAGRDGGNGMSLGGFMGDVYTATKWTQEERDAAYADPDKWNSSVFKEGARGNQRWGNRSADELKIDGLKGNERLTDKGKDTIDGEIPGSSGGEINY